VRFSSRAVVVGGATVFSLKEAGDVCRSITMKFLTLALLLLCANPVRADDFSDKFAELKKAGDEAAIEGYLEKSATNEAENPNYYATAGNYWWGVSQSVAVGAIAEGDYKLNPGDFSITDPKTGKKVGAITNAGKTNLEIPKKAIGLLSEGARKFPERADIALGLAHVQKKMNLKEGYVDTLSALLAQAKKDPDSLKWMKGGALPEPAKTFLPETVQDYTVALFNANSPATDALCGQGGRQKESARCL